MVGHLKLAHLDLQSLNSFVFRGLRHVQVSLPIFSKQKRIKTSNFWVFFFFCYSAVEHPGKRFGCDPTGRLHQYEQYRTFEFDQ